jgi:CoA transferase family III
MARRPRGADPPRFTPSPERTPSAHADQGRPSDGGGRGEAIWARCAKALGHPEWCEDPRFATNRARMANRDALEAAMNAVLTTKTTNDWVDQRLSPARTFAFRQRNRLRGKIVNQAPNQRSGGWVCIPVGSRALCLNATHRYQIGRRRPIGECPPIGFGPRCLSTSVRLSSNAPS